MSNSRPTSLRYGAGVIALAAAYFVTARLGLSLATVHENVTLVWPPTGLALAALLLMGRRYWPGVTLGAFLANAVTGVSLLTAAGIGAGNTLEALLGAWMLSRLLDFRCQLDRVQDALGLIVFGAALSTTAGATVGSLSLCLGGAAAWRDFAVLWSGWWLGDAMGAMLLTPALLTWWDGPPAAPAAGRWAEALALVVALTIMSQVVFGGWLPDDIASYPLAHTLMPLLVWAALRFGPRGASLATLAVAGQAIWDTVHRLGPFGRYTLGESLLLLQIFTGVAAITALILAALAAERDRSEQERRALEGRIRQAQKLESLGVMAGGIAHDFNNLLMGVLGHASIARLQLPPGNPLHASLERIERTAERAAELTQQMLAYAGRAPFEALPVDLSRVVEAAVAPEARDGVPRERLALRLAAELPAIQGDPAQLRRAVAGLLANAADAVGDQGRITITTGVAHADVPLTVAGDTGLGLPPGDYVYVEIADTGCGMDADTLTKIFDPFFTTKFTGRGLGLAAVLGIVRGHQGGIHVESEPGRGTTFKLLLPAAGPPVPAPAAAAPAATSGHLILVVDDDTNVRDVVAIMLRAGGHRVLTARDGREGVAAFEQHADGIAAVLLDMTMPGMSGEEAFHAIRRIRPDARVILSSGYSEEEATRMLTGSQPAGFIQKPYRLESLLAKVRAVLDTPSPFSPPGRIPEGPLPKEEGI